VTDQTTGDENAATEVTAADAAPDLSTDAAETDDVATDRATDDVAPDPEDTDLAPGTEDTAPDTEDTAPDPGTEAPARSRLEHLEHEGDIAADYLEELLDIADLDGDLDIDVEGDRAAVSIVGAELRQLVGRNGEVLEALQELTRLAVFRETGDRSRLMLDVSGFRAEKRTTLEKLATETVAEVRESGEPVALDPMTPFERKVVHDAVAAAGLRSESEGEEPRRHVVVLPAE
jgi:spoIIIJ-associated protein